MANPRTYRLRLGAHPAAVSGETYLHRNDNALEEVASRLHGMGARKVVAWVVGTGGHSFGLSDPDEDGRQNITKVYDRYYEPLDHSAMKKALADSGLSHELWAMDILPENVELAKRELPESADVKYVEGNIAETHPAARPHVIFCHNVLHSLEKELALQTLGELVDALRPQGHALDKLRALHSR